MLRSFAHGSLTFLVALLCSTAFAAGNSGITYQGRILKPDGSPLAGSNVQFRLQIRTPNANNCLMYEEVQALDMRNSGGVFSLTINDGSGSRMDATGLGLDRIFANRGAFNFSASTCQSGSTYTPTDGDGRNLVVLFKDETMGTWEPIPSAKINYVPYAFSSENVQGFAADSLLRFVDGSGDPLTGLAPLSNAQYTALMALVNGSSSTYAKAGELRGTAVPAINTGEVLGWNGTAWVSQAVAGGANSVSTGMLQAGAVTGTKLDPAISISTSGTIASAVTTTRDFKIYAASPSLFYVGMAAPTLAASYTLTWPLNAGLSNQVLTTDGSGNLTWTTPAGTGISALTGDVTASGTGSVAATVAAVGGSTAAQVHSAELAANAATALSTVSTIVKRDGSGGFAAGAVTQTSSVYKDTGANTVTVQAPSAVTSSYVLKWPAAAGSASQVLTTDASGNLFWSSPLSSTSAFVQGGNTFGAGAVLGTNDNFDLRLRANGATAMTILPSGNVGVGTTSPGAALDVQGAGNLLAVGSNKLFLLAGQQTLSVQRFGTNSATVMTVDSSDTAAGRGVLNVTSNAGTRNLIYADAGGNVGIGTTSPAYKLDVAGDVNITGAFKVNGTNLTTGLTNFTESVNSAAPNATVPVVRLLATNAATNVDVALSPKGTGALLAQIPNSAVSGGNKRGTNAVDWQTGRYAATAVASGASSVVSGGTSNTASGTLATVTGGQNNVASGFTSTAGGNASVASGTNALAIGEQNIASNGGATAIGGQFNSATGTLSFVAGGNSNTASGMYSFAANAGTTAPALSQTTFGQNNMPVGTEDANTWVATDPLFVVGNGTGTGVLRSNALMILKNGKVGVGTTAPATKLEVVGSLRVGDGGETCGASLTGAIRYNGGNLQFCNGTPPWSTLGVAGAGITALTGDVTASGTGSVAATVAQVGGYSAANVAAGATLANAATAANTNDAIVKRDSAGAFVTSSAKFTSSMILKDGAAGGEISLAAPVGFTSYALTLPSTVGTSGQVLTTNGAGVTSWTTVAGGGGDFKKDGSVAMTGTIKAVDGLSTAPGITFSGNTVMGMFRSGTSLGFSPGGGGPSAYLGSDGSFLSQAKVIADGGVVAGGADAAYTFGADLNSGMGQSVVGELRLKANGATRLLIDASGNVGIGTTSPAFLLHTKNNTENVTMLEMQNNTTANGPAVIGRRSRDSAGSPTATQAGDFLLSIGGRGYGATGWAPYSTGSVVVVAEENFTDSARGTQVLFKTTPNGSTASQQRMTILANGTVGIGTTASNGKLNVKGSVVMEGATSGYTGFQPAATAGSTVWTLPAADGTNGQVLSTNGSGVLAWSTVSGGGSTIDSLTDAIASASNLFMGANTGSAITTGTDNVAVGIGSAEGLTTGSHTTVLGRMAGQGITNTNDNTAIGYNTLYGLKAGAEGNTAVGSNAAFNNSSGIGGYNTAIGFNALNGASGAENTAIGYMAMDGGSTGSYNIGVGESAASSSLGTYNVAIGYQAYTNTAATSVENVIIGHNAFFNNGGSQTANNNVVIGGQAASVNHVRSAINNVIIGASAAVDITSGGSNVIIGQNTAATLKTGASNILIGTGVNTPAAGTNNYLNIGNTIYGNTSTNSVGIGTTSPSAKLDVKGTFALSGSTSGAVKFAVPAAAGSATYTWPAAVPASNMVLQSDNTGALSWVAASGGGISALTGDVTASGTGSVAATVANVGGVTAANVATGANLANAATAANTIDTIVKRDSTGAFVTSSAKFTSSMILKDGAAGGEVSIATPTAFTSYTLTLPTTDGNSGEVLRTNGSGILSWAAAPAASQWTTQAPGINYMGGDVGIGTTSPSYKLDVSGDIGGWTYHAANSDETSPAYQTGDGNGMFSTSGNSLGLTTFHAERMRITSAGNVGIGTTSPAYKLDVVGDVNVTGNFKVNGVNFAAGGGDFMKDGSVAMTGNLSTGTNHNVNFTRAVGGQTPGLSWTMSDIAMRYWFNASSDGYTMNLGNENGNDQIQNWGTYGSTIQSSNNTTGSLQNALILSSKTNLDMVDGYGGQLKFQIQDTGAKNEIASINYYRDGSDTSGSLSIATKNAGTMSNVMTVAASGNVGIGTTAPVALLDLRKDQAGTTGLQITNTNATGTPGVALNNGSYYGALSIGKGSGGSMTLASDNTNGIYYLVDNASTAAHIWQTGAAVERMRLSNGGNLGIGTSNPNQLLHIRKSSGTAAVRLESTTGRTYDVASEPTTGIFKIADTATSNSVVFDGASGYVGIGTTSPVGNLHVYSPATVTAPTSSWVESKGAGTASAAYLRAINNAGKFMDMGVTGGSYTPAGGYGANTGYLASSSAGGISVMATSAGSGAIRFYTAGSGNSEQRMLIATSGNIGIGTSSPLAALHIGNGSGVVPVGGPQLFIEDDGTANTSALFQTAAASSTTPSFTITNAGNVGIGTTLPSQSLEVNGSVLASAYLYSSDRRLKKDITPIEKSLEKLLTLNTVTFNWITPKNKDEERMQIGLIAQDVQKVFPEAVTEDSQGWLRMNYQALISPIIDGMREMYRQVLGIDARTKALELEVAALKAENSQMKQEHLKLESRLDLIEKSMSRKPASSTKSGSEVKR